MWLRPRRETGSSLQHKRRAVSGEYDGADHRGRTVRHFVERGDEVVVANDGQSDEHVGGDEDVKDQPAMSPNLVTENKKVLKL